MKRLLLTAAVLFVVVQGQLLSLPDAVKGLVPNDIQELLAKLSDKQKELLKKADVNHDLGVKAIIGVNKLIHLYEKLETEEAKKFVLDVGNALGTTTTAKAKGILAKIRADYAKLSEKSKSSLRAQFPQPTMYLEHY